MNIEPTNLFKALKDQPAHEPPKRVTDEQKVEVANELHEWLNARGSGVGNGVERISEVIAKPSSVELSGDSVA